MQFSPKLTIDNLCYSVSDGTKTKMLLEIPRLEIIAGSRCALKGASGSGKTTFLRLIAGIITPDCGVICWGKNNVASLSTGERDRWRGLNVGFLFQDFRLFDGLSALENVLLPCGFYSRVTQRDRDQARELLRLVGVNPATRTVHLSRGEMQRTALARVLMKRPSIILADEPTASLDTKNAEHVLDLLIQAANDCSATLIVASHDPLTLKRFDRCLTVRNETVSFEV